MVDKEDASREAQVMQMFDKAEAEYRELSEKKRIVENDKEKIKKVRYTTENVHMLAQTIHPKSTSFGNPPHGKVD